MCFPDMIPECGGEALSEQMTKDDEKEDTEKVHSRLGKKWQARAHIGRRIRKRRGRA
jgi:hypothetical protein